MAWYRRRQVDQWLIPMGAVRVFTGCGIPEASPATAMLPCGGVDRRLPAGKGQRIASDRWRALTKSGSVDFSRSIAACGRRVNGLVWRFLCADGGRGLITVRLGCAVVRCWFSRGDQNFAGGALFPASGVVDGCSVTGLS